MEMSPEAKRNAQIEKADLLKDLLLDDLVNQARAGNLSSADRVLIYRMLRENGWDLDPSKLPKSAKEMLTRQVKFDDDLDGEPHLKVI